MYLDNNIKKRHISILYAPVLRHWCIPKLILFSRDLDLYSKYFLCVNNITNLLKFTAFAHNQIKVKVMVILRKN